MPSQLLSVTLGDVMAALRVAHKAREPESPWRLIRRRVRTEIWEQVIQFICNSSDTLRSYEVRKDF